MNDEYACVGVCVYIYAQVKVRGQGKQAQLGL